MADEKKPFRPPLPPGMQPPLPPGQFVPGGERDAPRSIQDAAGGSPPVKSQPLGVGAVYTDSTLTPGEREVLTKLGWKPGDPIPTNMAELLQNQTAAFSSGVQLPASSPDAERTPLSEEQVNRGSEILSGAKEALQQTQAMSSMQADESVQRAMAAASGAGPADVDIVDDTKDPGYDGDPKSDTGADPPLARCPHCEWDLRVRDPIEVTTADKQRFLQALLGQVPFQKEFRVFGGALKAIYRSLSPGELDSCFEQAYLERRQGRYQSPDAYFEQINRYRIALQLVRVETTEVNHTLPQTVAGWEEKLGEPETKTEDRTVKRVSEFMFSQVIRTESFNRILGGLAGEFNSLVGKLEANAHNSDFWSTTKSAT